MSQQNKTTLQSNINSQIADNTSGNISAADVRDNLINITDSLLFNSGSQSITGSLTATQGFTGSLQGTATTASYVLNAVSSSFASTASYVLNAVSSSFSTTSSFSRTSSFVNPLTQTVTINGSLIQTGSHAEGKDTYVFGNSSHAEGFSTTAFGSSSHAEGAYTNATGSYSHAEGSNTLAIGIASHAEGEETSAIGFASHAEGLYTIASGSHQHVLGRYNTQGDNTSLMIVGNGTDNNNNARKDAFKVRMSGSIILPTTQSSSPAWTGTDGEMVFATVTGNHRFYVWMAGAWRSGSLS
jgi:hypothetical protein